MQFTACFQEFHYGAFLAAIDMVEQGLLGRVHLAEVDYYNGIGPWVQQYWWTRTARHGVSRHGQLRLPRDDAADVADGRRDAGGGHILSRPFRRRRVSPTYEFDPTQISLFRYAGGRVGKVTSCLDAIQPYTFRVSAVGSEGSVIDDRFLHPPHRRPREHALVTHGRAQHRRRHGDRARTCTSIF